jgi:putative Ca2+/H+ antiporter (TMEM165/GDT1 family)
MTLLSTALGVAAPMLLPRSLTHWAGAGLFLFFGVQMIVKAWRTAPAEGASEELEEVEGELKADDARVRYGAWARHLSPVLAQTFVMTFLAEWGDRSQIATITMGADYNAAGICVGGSAGHATATALAVVGGRLLASRISERTMAFAGGATFLLFGLLACLEDPSKDITEQAVPSFFTAWGRAGGASDSVR